MTVEIPEDNVDDKEVDVPKEYLEALRIASEKQETPNLSEPVPEKVEEKKEVSQSNNVTLSMEQFSQLMQNMTTLAQQVDALKSELEVQRSSVPQSSNPIPDAGTEEAVMHTMRKIGQAREMIKEQNLAKARESIDLAVEAALIDFRKNPPKGRR